ncbi:Na+:solute symporter, partial [Planctomycetota bacterium]
FLALVLIQWWAWKNTDGGGIAVQRMLACKNERHAVYAVLWFNIAHYVLRCWPWILVALCSLILLTPADLPVDAAGGIKHEAAYPVMINLLLPTGLKGILIASFLAAFMSTIDTHMNWGASYVVNDFYKRFLVRGASESHYVLISRLAGVVIVIGAGVAAFNTERIRDAFDIILNLTAGVGLVHLARWFWWRTNAWSEISCMIVSLPAKLFRQLTRLHKRYLRKHWEKSVAVAATA